MIRVGPAGWSYADWDERVYPRLKPRGFHPLRLLADFVDCVEVNSTFYASPRAEHSRRWTELVAAKPGFRFVVKLLRDFTHEPEPQDETAWERAATEFRSGIGPLVRARRLSAILVQLPGSCSFGARRVRRLGRLHALFDDVPLVLEAHHPSWFTPPAMSSVRGLSYSLAHVDLPAAWNQPPPWHAPTGPVGYLRLHGRNASTWSRKDAARDDRSDYLYPPDEIQEVAAKAGRIARDCKDTFVVAGNHFGGKAIASAIEVLYALRGEPLSVPAEIVHSFPHLAPITRIHGQRELFG